MISSVIKNRTIRKSVFVSLFASGQIVLNSASVFAQTAKEICEGSGGTWDGSQCVRDGDPGLFGPGGLFEKIANALLFIVGALSVVMLIVGGIRYVTSGGDSNAVQGAKNTILYAIVGIVVAFLAFAAVNWITTSLAEGS